MADAPLVSIVTPSLNQGRFIEATIRSVLSQEYPRIEYIVVDGGSTDGTLDVLRRYEGQLRWISEPDRGQSDAINKGFRMARGQILAWLNSDDTYLPGAVRGAVDHFSQHPECGMVYGEGYRIDESGAVIGRFPATEPFDLWRLVHVIDYILQQTAFFRRGVLDAVGDLDEQLTWGMDWDLFIRIGKRFRVDYLPLQMANLREYPAAKTFAGGRKRFWELVGVMRKHGSRRYPPAYVAYGIDTHLRLGFGALERVVPDRLAGSLRQAQRLLEWPAYRLVGRICRKAQGLYADGWVTRRSHFLFGAVPGGTALVIRGARHVARGRGGLRLRAIANGVGLGTRRVGIPGDFEAVWTLPGPLREADALDVEVTCDPTFRRSRRPWAGDRRRLGFHLKEISVV